MLTLEQITLRVIWERSAYWEQTTLRVICSVPQLVDSHAIRGAWYAWWNARDHHNWVVKFENPKIKKNFV